MPASGWPWLCQQHHQSGLLGYEEAFRCSWWPEAQRGTAAGGSGCSTPHHCGLRADEPGSRLHGSRAKEFASSWCALADARRLIAVAAGAAAGKFLHYEEAAPAVAAQTAYGIEAEVEGYEDNYDAESMLFMDFRRHHTGLWPDTAHK